MKTKLNEAGSAQQTMQPPEHLTPEEQLLLRFYRKLSEPERAYIRRAVEAMYLGGSPS